jgi:hypothetical protein
MSLAVRIRSQRRHLLWPARALLLGLLFAPISPRAETRVHLLMVDQAGCIYCLRWDREVGVAYPKSPQGRFAPLVRRPLDHPDVRRLSPPAVYTPTFVVIDGAREVGRIVGYPGADFFWEELDQILARAGFDAAPVEQAPPGPQRASAGVGGRTIADRRSAP